MVSFLAHFSIYAKGGNRSIRQVRFNEIHQYSSK
jgi:hypothetical protein